MTHSLRHADVCSLSILAFVLFYLGRWVSWNRHSVQLWSTRLGIATCVLWAGFELSSLGISVPETVAAEIFRGAVFGGLVYGTSAVTFPVIGWIADTFINDPLRQISSWRTNLRRRREEKRAEWERRRRSEADRQEWERQRPEREAEERRRQAEEVRRLELERQRQLSAIDAASRRKEARSQCELFFNLYRADLGKRFTRAMLDSYMATYMSDADPADVVERRAAELRGIIDRHLERVGKAERPTSIDQLAVWYVREKERIDALDIPDDVKDEYRMMLETRHADISTEILERLHP
jgi:hypothetical protein